MLFRIAIGFVVGTLVGLTGLGGGVLLLPLLIFGLGVAPIVAVGSDAVFNSVTKLGSGLMHWKQRTVDWGLVAALVSGSIPASIAGVAVLAYLRRSYGSGVNDFLKLVVGFLLVVIPVFLVLQGQLKAHDVKAEPSRTGYRWQVVAIGAVAGFLVGMTSIGSGTITMMFLFLLFPYSPVLIIGTDIVHAVLLTGFTSLLHLRLGTVDPILAITLLAGSIPGSLLGTKLSTYVPGYWLKRVLCGLLFVTGARMILL